MLGSFLDRLGIVEITCLLCGLPFRPEDQGFVCDDCLRGLKPEPVPYLSRIEPVAGYRVFGSYRGPVGEILRIIKFKHALPLARRLGRAIAGDLGRYVEEVSPDLVTFVPVHLWRFWSRGFDQNEEILKGTGLDFDKVLVRVKHSRPLARLRREDRIRAVQGSFKVRPSFLDRINSKRVLVVDDVLTTGSTAVSVTVELISLGAEKVFFYFVSVED